MALPDYSMRQLLEAGVHFGHQSHRWNPKMAPFIFGARNSIHIIDLAQTVPLLHQALKAISDTVARGGRILFVGTKRQAQDAIADAAKRSAQYYVNSRWLGGTLTNWKTISRSIHRLRKLDEMLGSGEAQVYTKKERLTLTREKEKLDRALGGIRDMGGLPDLMFVIDTNKEDIAINEARRLGIPVAAVIDTNSNPDGISFPVPGNDDAARAITLYCDVVAKAAIDGISRAEGELGADPGGGADGAGPRRFPAAVRSARGRRRPQEARGRIAGHREDAQRSRHLPFLADRRVHPGGHPQDRRRSRAPRQGRGVDHPGQAVHGRVRTALRPPATAILRPRE